MRLLLRPVLPSKPTVRATVILVVPCMIGAIAGTLTYVACHSIPQALLAYGSATGNSAQLLGQIMGTPPERTADSQDNPPGENHDDPTQKKA